MVPSFASQKQESSVPGGTRSTGPRIVAQVVPCKRVVRNLQMHVE